MIRCPTPCLWSKYDDLKDIYGDGLGILKIWARQVQGKVIASGHQGRQSLTYPDSTGFEIYKSYLN